MAVKYDNATKQTWRGWAWNQVAKRVLPGSTVMVLCGDAAADVPYAKKRGLEVVGVDIDRDAVSKFRESGGVATQDRVLRQLLARKPEGAILDMLGGLTDDSFTSPVFGAYVCSAVVWNGLRGRDRGVGEVAKNLGGQTIPDYSTGRLRSTMVGKHRGKIAWLILCTQAWRVYNGEPMFASAGDRRTVAIDPLFALEFAETTRPAFYSYRSKDGGQWFDSVAWSGVPGVADGLSGRRLLADNLACRRSIRLAAAAKAVSTMRREMN